ncbi:MAG: helix-turn-helix domain-containing protein [Chloroflexi bacterium]|nr:helix-turn-helix domain-containing protein [Chloroflexota bacterium]
MRKSDLIIHPVRFRILRTIGDERLTTQEISDRLPDVPKSSIYRHLKLLLDNDAVTVADTRLVNGIQEKVYAVLQPPSLGPGDVANLTADEHIGYFTTYALMLIQDFAAYLQTTEAHGAIDMLADRVGYHEASFYATPQELDVVVGALNQALLPLLKNEGGNGRRLYKLATVMHPQEP